MKPTLLAILSIFMLQPCIAATPSADELLRSSAQSILAKAQPEDAQYAAFSRALLSSKEWQRELLDSGPIEQPEFTIEALFQLWKTDPSLTESPINRAMATALALEAPRKKWDTQLTSDRYQFFKEKHAAGLLNSMYDSLTMFQRRYLASGVQHVHLNDRSSLEYLNTEVCLPSTSYPSACWYAQWILLSPFGDSIHGPFYYQPFESSFGSAAEMIRKVGGVCGSLSNFGANAAIANGIPAATMGEPGHCAYTVMTSPHDWTPSYSLSWDRGLHTSYFQGGSWSWHLFNNLAHKDTATTYASDDLRRLAQYYQSQNNPTAALATLKSARQTNPCDYQNWIDTAELLQSSNAPIQSWKDLHDDVLVHIAPQAGEIAWDYLQKYIYPKILIQGDQHTDDRKHTLLAFQKALNGWGIARWNYQKVLTQQLNLLSNDTSAQDKFMIRCFGIHAKANIFTPIIFEEQLKRSDKDEQRRLAFIAAIGKGLSKSKSADFTAVINTLAAQILPDAAKRGDKASFQYIGKLTEKTLPACDVSPEPFPGILLSSGGCLLIKGAGNRYDTPAAHWGVIEEHGGFFHTDSGNAFATVQLGNFGRLSGVTIVVRNSSIYRLNGAILQSSLNGSDWTDLHTFTGAQRVNRVPLEDKNIDAGYVRVIQPNGEPLHFEKFHVFGKKQN